MVLFIEDDEVAELWTSFLLCWNRTILFKINCQQKTNIFFLLPHDHNREADKYQEGATDCKHRKCPKVYITVI